MVFASLSTHYCRARTGQMSRICGGSSKEEQNHEVYNLASIFDLAHSGPHGSFYGQAVRPTILAGTIKLRTSRIRALWTAVSSPLIRGLFISTWLAFWASHVDYSRGGEIWTLDLTDPNQFRYFATVVHMAWSFFIAVRSTFLANHVDYDEL